MNMIHSWESSVEMAVMDESNAFSAVATPEWMWAYFTAPLVLASDVWSRPSSTFQSSMSPLDWIAPAYRGLPMGCPHSVHILMSINLRQMGQSLINKFRPPSNWEVDKLDLQEEAEVKKTERVWAPVRNGRIDTQRELKSPAVFPERARPAKSAIAPIMVVLICFAGARREGDLEQMIHEWGAKMGLLFLVESVDLAFNGGWGLGDMRTMSLLLSMISSGLIDFVLGGPPCASWSRVRFLLGGPRPLRFHGTAQSGRPDLTSK